MLIENGGQFFDVFRAKHPDRYGYSILYSVKYQIWCVGFFWKI